MSYHSLAFQLVILGASGWLVAFSVLWVIDRREKRRVDAKWVDDLLDRYHEDLKKRYRNGAFRAKSLWNDPR